MQKKGALIHGILWFTMRFPYMSFLGSGLLQLYMLFRQCGHSFTHGHGLCSFMGALLVHLSVDEKANLYGERA